MKKILITLAALATATPALAISRHNTPGMACETIRDTLRREGAAILRYPSPRKPGLTLYDRYVRSEALCAMDEYAERAYVPARDNARCPVLQCERLPDPDSRPRMMMRRNLPL